MAKRVAVIQTELHEHPAVKAWGRLRPGGLEPRQIEVLKQKHKSGVYRLAGLGPGGTAVIAKRCQPETAWVEEIIYQEILPRVPISALECYGCLDEQEYCWIFLEDAGGSWYSEHVPAHRHTAARWMALMHTTTFQHGVGANLPDVGPGHYLERLRAARGRIVRYTSSPVLSGDDRAVLEALVSHCETLEARWDRIERSCGQMTRTLVHGDFRAKNVRIRSGQEGELALLLLDWEAAGWGVPAIDIAQVDLAVYGSVTRERWPQLDLGVLEDVARIGRIFQWLAAIDWESTRLSWNWMEKPMYRIRPCEVELRAALNAVDWEC